MNILKIFSFSVFLRAFAFQVSAQNIVAPLPTNEEFAELLNLGPKKIKNLPLGFSSPNELDGFAFFRDGKLKNLKIGISTADDIKEIFGTDCKAICEYDKNWRIVFTYFKNISKEVTGNGRRIKLIADPQSANKIYSVKLVPKNRVSFGEIRFPDEFYRSRSFAFGHDFSGNAAGISFDVYVDSYGLKYFVFDKESYTTFNEKDARQPGNLISIEYVIPNNLEEKMFIEQN